MFGHISFNSSFNEKCCRQILWGKSKETLHFYFFLENPILYGIMWKDVVEPDKPKMKIWCMRIACCVSEATNTLSESVMLIASPLEQWNAQTHLNVTLYVHCLSCLLL